MKRIIDIVLFLGERGLAFRGSSQRIGSPNNGNFLGTVELLRRYDPVLKEHVTKVQESQTSSQRLSVHYLSSDSQNDFISACAQMIRSIILEEQKAAKYFSVIVDATPDSSHTEQTTFILRYVTCHYSRAFLQFVDCNKKTGTDIAQLILKFLDSHHISISNCRGQGYDNSSNRHASVMVLRRNYFKLILWLSSLLVLVIL